MSKIQQPSNQIKLTNVSIVRLKKGGKRFEIACYKNKVQEWRNGVEKDVDSVLQISNVFVNVSKGQVAKHQDLKSAFGTADIGAVVSEILNKGETQINEKERDHDLSSLRREIATLVSEKCVDPSTQRPYPVSIIEKAMGEAGWSVRQGKTAKSQVSECIKLLQSNSTLPIERAKMRIHITLPLQDASNLSSKILEHAQPKEDEHESNDEWETTILIDPASFRIINELLQKECSGRGRIETVTMAVISQSTTTSVATTSATSSDT